MEEILEILRSKFVIIEIKIVNFAICDSDIVIEIKIYSKRFGYKIVSFETVLNLNIESESYGCSVNPSIIIEDRSMLQMENIMYAIDIIDNNMTFYCKDIKLKD